MRRTYWYVKFKGEPVLFRGGGFSTPSDQGWVDKAGADMTRFYEKGLAKTYLAELGKRRTADFMRFFRVVRVVEHVPPRDAGTWDVAELMARHLLRLADQRAALRATEARLAKETFASAKWNRIHRQTTDQMGGIEAEIAAIAELSDRLAEERKPSGSKESK